MLKRNIRYIFVLLAIAFLVSACANMRAAIKQDPQQAAYYAYDQALQWYTQSAETYDMHYQLADEATKAKWKAEIDPIFKDMKKILDNWQTSLSVGYWDSPDVQNFKTLKTKILLMGLSFFKE